MPVLRPIDHWFIEDVLPHEAGFLRLARRLSPLADAGADLVQEAYARLFATDGWAAIACPQAYVARSIRHIAIERMRRARIVDFRQLAEADHGALIDDTPDPSAIAEARDRWQRFSDAVMRLPDRCRDVFVRRRIHEQSPQEISEALGVSISTLEKRLARAYVLLTQHGVGAEPDGDAPTLPADIAREN